MISNKFDQGVWKREIIEALAEILFEHEWLSYQDERKTQYLPATEDTPETPESAYVMARLIVLRYERVNGKTIDELIHLAAQADDDQIDRKYAEQFGRHLCYMVTGCGRTWTDDHEEITWTNDQGEIVSFNNLSGEMSFDVSDQFADGRVYEIHLGDTKSYEGSRGDAFFYLENNIREMQAGKLRANNVTLRVDEESIVTYHGAPASIPAAENDDNDSGCIMLSHEYIGDYFARIGQKNQIFKVEDPYATLTEDLKIDVNCDSPPNVEEMMTIGICKQFILRFPKSSAFQAEAMAWPKCLGGPIDWKYTTEQGNALFTVSHYSFDSEVSAYLKACEVKFAFGQTVCVFDIQPSEQYPEGHYVESVSLNHDGFHHPCDPLTGKPI